ncbi:MAG: YraN family protein [Longimicrobiales bacterium]
MADSHELGRQSERVAAHYLEARGYDIVERNFRVGHKEVDLIVRRDDLIAFVEVKARAGAGYGHPLEAITWVKRREVGHVARVWIAAHGRRGFAYRFDAIAVIWRDGRPDIEHVPNAWAL